MPAHRKPTEVLDRTGANRKNPQRRRKPPQGRGELSTTPPSHLRKLRGACAAWKEIVESIPSGVATGSDRFVVERAAVLLARSRSGEIWKAADETNLRAYFGALGLAPEARERLGGAGDEPETNPHASVGRAPAGVVPITRGRRAS